jgi:hypothetical protein
MLWTYIKLLSQKNIVFESGEMVDITDPYHRMYTSSWTILINDHINICVVRLDKGLTLHEARRERHRVSAELWLLNSR